MFPEYIVEALEDYSCSVLEITPNGIAPNDIIQTFQKIFRAKWDIAYQHMLADVRVDPEDNESYYPCTADECFPLSFCIIRDKVIFQFDPLTIPYCFGEFCEIMEACTALDDAVAELKEQYPEIEASGYVAFPWSDSRCGDTVMYAIGEEQDVYPLFGEIVNEAFDGKSLSGVIIEAVDEPFSFRNKLWENLSEIDNMDDYNMMLEFLKTYKPVLRECVANFILEHMETPED